MMINKDLEKFIKDKEYYLIIRDKDVLKKLSSVQFPRTHFKITEELKSRRVIRTRNNPVSDYAERPAHRKTGFCLTGNSTQGVDVVDKNGKNIR